MSNDQIIAHGSHSICRKCRGRGVIDENTTVACSSCDKDDKGRSTGFRTPLMELKKCNRCRNGEFYDKRGRHLGKCFSCNGTGTYRIYGKTNKCFICHGVGTTQSTIKITCEACNGSGIKPLNQLKEYWPGTNLIPANTTNGTAIA